VSQEQYKFTYRLDDFIQPEVMKRIYSHEKKNIEHSIRHLQRIEEVSNRKISSNDEKISKRQAILEEQVRRLEKHQMACQKASERLNRSRAKLDALRVAGRNHYDVMTQSRRGIFTSQNQLDRASRLLEDEETIKSRAIMLHAVSELIDPNFPIEVRSVTDNEHVRQIISWTTKKLRLKVPSEDVEEFAFGAWTTRTEFGPFDIKLVRTITSGSSYLSATAVARPGSEPGPEGHHHPHFSKPRSNSTAGGDSIIYYCDICLGNSKEHILDYMSSLDYTSVVYYTMEVITSYNSDDPYCALDRWEPTKRHNLWCSSCDSAILYCNCTRSVVSGKVVNPDFLSPCGATYAECSRHHSKTTSNEPLGIGGTTCVPKNSISQTNIGRPLERYRDIDKVLDLMTERIDILDELTNQKISEE